LVGRIESIPLVVHLFIYQINQDILKQIFSKRLMKKIDMILLSILIIIMAPAFLPKVHRKTYLNIFPVFLTKFETT